MNSDINISLDIILYMAGAITGIAAAYAILSKAFKKTVSKVVADVIAGYMEEYERRLDKRLEEIDKKLDDYIKSSEKSDNMIKDALLAETRMYINDTYKHYKDKEKIDPHTMDTLESLYESYTALGGNHFIEGEMEALRAKKLS